MISRDFIKKNSRHHCRLCFDKIANLSFVVFGSDLCNECFDLLDDAHDEVNEFLDEFHGSALLIHYSRISSHA